ncbi:hypothetical protein NKL07_00050 [Mesorhizobium sp. C280B]|uniref:hypothetical protein n=1 Tax=unclassified Mesorhizobium TaxID=325217 RepID=UPI0003CE962D|nr:hypothetical protein [Mesorhizobium sp. LSJC280B00]ESW74508.1 hypothetical protein X772_33020 [Mesorhizobium sp. LSJC280B00]
MSCEGIRHVTVPRRNALLCVDLGRVFGDFYEIDERLQVVHLGKVMASPGDKYAFLYALADPNKRWLHVEDAGKLMALCAYGQTASSDRDEQALIDFLLPRHGILLNSLSKEDLRNSPYHNVGVTHQKFTNLARRVSDAIFDSIHTFAKKNLTKGFPLLIARGCGLNCESKQAFFRCFHSAMRK